MSRLRDVEFWLTRLHICRGQARTTQHLIGVVTSQASPSIFSLKTIVHNEKPGFSCDYTAAIGARYGSACQFCEVHGTR
jgi:hypothetical protein